MVQCDDVRFWKYYIKGLICLSLSLFSSVPSCTHGEQYYSPVIVASGIVAGRGGSPGCISSYCYLLTRQTKAAQTAEIVVQGKVESRETIPVWSL